MLSAQEMQDNYFQQVEEMQQQYKELYKSQVQEMQQQYMQGGIETNVEQGTEYRPQKEESSEELETQVQETQKTEDNTPTDTAEVKDNQAEQGRTVHAMTQAHLHRNTTVRSDTPPFFAIWLAFVIAIVTVTIVLIKKNKRRQAKAREAYKRYDETMAREQKENASAIDNEIKEKTADLYKSGISDIIDDGNV